MNRCPGYRKALEIHTLSFDPLAATAVHVHISLASQRRITSHSPCRLSISQAPTQACHDFNGKGRAYEHVHVYARFQKHPLETNISGSTPPQNISKPAIPHLDARFHKRPLETHISGMTAHQNQLSPSRRSIPRGTIRSFTNGSDCLKAASRVWTLIDAYFNPAMRDKATTCTTNTNTTSAWANREAHMLKTKAQEH